jgi:hypothetical protein
MKAGFYLAIVKLFYHFCVVLNQSMLSCISHHRFALVGFPFSERPQQSGVLYIVQQYAIIF